MSAAGSPQQHAWSTANPVFTAYVFYSCVLVLKMLATTLLVVRQRHTKKVFMNPEDKLDKNSKVLPGGDPDVERPRRAHLNDLENIPAFWVAGLLYCLTNPAPALALNLFRAYTGARIMHTIVYAVVPLPQPSRAIAWAVGYGITIYMAVTTVMHFA
ncbi:microsomal glutathione S-transferase 1-like isoform X1 [Frankliniella occidentalis]|uniref:Microsomal glutathione S-transferase 1 n=2 Tax=Frankliniella occidentalis TaxID=133901 RepID=A0A9C6XVR9_FRAOC|nr:microsomal glutathione S-transferase 1-like isoform X1 [Frankliniella occidentalis]